MYECDKCHIQSFFIGISLYYQIIVITESIPKLKDMFGLYYCAKTYNRFLKILLLACLLITFCDTANAKKIQTPLYGRVYLQSGDSIIADGDLRVGIPQKNKNLEIIEKAYTRDCGIQARIKPEEVDSLIMWQPTAPKRPHTFRFIKDYGWCWQLERSP